jgi:hypothetical protein
MAQLRRRQLRQRRNRGQSHLCRDCRMNTVHKREDFMVVDAVWDAITTQREKQDGLIICIGCLEERLGRRLTPADFTECALNAGVLGLSARLMDRLGITECLPLAELGAYILKQRAKEALTERS